MRPYFQGYDKFSKGFSINFIRDLEAVYRFDRLGRKHLKGGEEKSPFWYNI